MSNEQLSQEEVQKRIEMMKENCPFCKIIGGEIPAKKIFEDELCLAILDINPATTGHILLMPKEHYMMMPLVPDEVLGHLSVISKLLTDLLKETLDARDVTCYIANGVAAGQQSQHFMMHLIPRYLRDNLSFEVDGKEISNEELNSIFTAMKSKLSNTNFN